MKTKEEYQVWKEVAEHCEAAIQDAETTILINKEFLKRAKEILSRLPVLKVKEQKPEGVA